MNDKKKTREELIADLETLRQELSRFQEPDKGNISPGNEPCLAILDNMLEGCQIIGPDWRYLYVNDAVTRHGRQPKENLLGHTIMEVYPGIENTELFTFMQRCMQERVPHEMGNEFIYPDGDRGWFDLRIRPVPQGIFILSIDITKRKEAQDELRENEEKLRLFIQYSPAMLAMFDREMHYLAASQRWIDVYYLNDQEIIGRSHYEIFPDIPERWKNAHRRGMAGEIIRCEEDKFIFEDGTVQWGRWEIRPWQKADHSIGGIIIFSEDITAYKQVLEKIRESETRFRTIVEQTPAVTYFAALDENSTTTYISPQIKEILGFTAEEYQENPDIWLEQLHPEDRERVLQEVKRSHQKGERLSTEYRMFTKDGRVVWCSDVADVVKNESGEASFLQGLMTDITLRKQAEARIDNYISRVESLLEIGKAVSSTLNLENVLDIIMQELNKYSPYDSISIQILQNRSLQIIACQGFDQPEVVIGLKYPLETKFPNFKVIDSKESFAVEDITLEYPLFQAESQKYQSGNIRSWLGVPLVSKDVTIGMIALDRATVDPFSEEEIRMASAIAGHAALAIENARLFNEAAKRTNKLKALRLIDHAISSSFDINIMLNVLLEQVITHLELDAADILLFDPYQSILEYGNGVGFLTDNIKSTRLRIGEGYSGRAALERRLVNITNLATADPPFAQNTRIADEGFVSYCVLPLIAKGAIKGVMEIFHRTRLDVSPALTDDLYTFAGQAAIAIDNAQLFENLTRSNMDLMTAYDATIEGWSKIIEYRDKENEGHTQRVTDLTMQLARMMGVSEEKITQVRRGALLHDIGKLHIPDSILIKEGKLNDEEWETVKKHPQFAYNILSQIEYLRPALDIPYCHHERWDGTGYPRGLKGEEIPLAARIFSVANVWDSLISGRPYREAWSEEKTLAFIREKSGEYFDPQVVQTFVLMLEK